MSTPAIVVMTAVIGGYDHPPSIASASDGIRFIVVGDEPEADPPWELVTVDRYWRDNKLTTAYVKTQAHLFAPPDSIVVWVDGHLDELRMDADRIRAEVAASPLAAHQHRMRQSVAAEAAQVLEDRLDVRWRVERHMQRLADSGFPDDVGLSELRMNIRDLRDPRVLLHEELWWRNIIGGSRREQLGYDAAAWAVGIRVQRYERYYFSPDAWYAKRKHAAPTGRRIEDEHAYSTRFRSDGLPEGYPEPAYVWEPWREPELEPLRRLNRARMSVDGGGADSYAWPEGFRRSALSPPDPRLAWKREYLRRCWMGCQRVARFGIGDGTAAAVGLLADPRPTLRLLDTDGDAAASAVLRALFEDFGERVQVAPMASGWEVARLGPMDLVDLGVQLERTGSSARLERWLAQAPSGQAIVVDDPWRPTTRATLGPLLARGMIRASDPGLPSCGDIQRYVRT